MKNLRLTFVVCTMVLTGLVWQEVYGKTATDFTGSSNRFISSSQNGDTSPASSNLAPKKYNSLPTGNDNKYSYSSSLTDGMQWDLSGGPKEKLSRSVERRVENWQTPKLSNATKSPQEIYSSSSYRNPEKNADITSKTAEKCVSSSNNSGEINPVSVNRTKQGIMERLSGDCWEQWKRFLSDSTKIRGACQKFAQTFTAIFNTICDPGREISSRKSLRQNGRHLRRQMPVTNTEASELKRKRNIKRYREHLDSGLSLVCSMILKMTESQKGLHSKHVPHDIAINVNTAEDSFSLHKTPNETEKRRSKSSGGTRYRSESRNSRHVDPNAENEHRDRKRKYFPLTLTRDATLKRFGRSANEAESYNNYYPHLYPYSGTEGLQYLQVHEPEINVKRPDPVYIYEDATVKPGQYVEVYPGAYQPSYSYSKFPRSYWLFHVLKGLFTIWEGLQTLAILYLLWKVAVLTVLPREMEPTFTSSLEYALHYLGIPTTFSALKIHDSDDNTLRFSGARAENHHASRETVHHHEIQYYPVTNDTQKEIPHDARENSTVSVPAVNSRADLLEISTRKIKSRNSVLNISPTTTKKLHHKKEAAIGNQIAFKSKTSSKKQSEKRGTNDDRTSKESSITFPQKHFHIQEFLKLLKSHWRQHFSCVGCGIQGNPYDPQALAAQSPALHQPVHPLLDISS